MVTVGELIQMIETYQLVEDMPIRITINGICFDAESISWNKAIKEEEYSVKIRVFVKPDELLNQMN